MLDRRAHVPVPRSACVRLGKPAPAQARCSLLVAALALVATAGSACGSPDYGDAPAGAASQFSITQHWGAHELAVFWLVVDDGDGAETAQLRARVAAHFASEAARRVQYGARAACLAADDPAAFSPIDWNVVVVHPSAAADELFTSAADDARLHWSESRPSAEGAAAFAAAVADALELAPTAGGPFAPLHAYKQLGSLVAGEREAATPREAALLKGLEYERNVAHLPIVALSRDDDSPEEPEANTLELTPSIGEASVVVPRLASELIPAACGRSQEPTVPRLQRWLRAQDLLSWNVWPCAGTPLGELGVAPDCSSRCDNVRAVEDGDGAAACVVLTESELDACDASAGWLDPADDDGVRRPRTIQYSNSTRRICEVRQLTGDALLSCRTSLACEACEPGFCLTDVAQLIAPCASGRSLPLRVIGAAATAAPAIVTITCNSR